MDKKDGGQAFPHGDPTNGGDIGMTLRDYFAAKALPLVSDHENGTVGDAARELGISPDKYEWRIHWPMLCARRAYAWADAMLAERAKDQP